jgi:tetratricopeptide (TPR) repeat protein
MSRILRGASALRLLGLGLGAIFAALGPSFVYAQGGGQPGQFMDYGAGGRALGMGGAFFAIADDATAAYWNPAGLAQIQQKELTAMQASLFLDTTLGYISYAHPTATGGTFALGITQLTSSNFEKVGVTFDPITGNPTLTNQGTFSDTERAFTLAWGRYVTEDLSIGLSGNYVMRTLDNSSDSMQSVDVAAMRKFGPYRFAIGVKNIASWSSGDTTDSLPIILKAGNSLQLFKNRLNLAVDLEKVSGGDVSWRFGGEYWLIDWWAVRCGILGSPGPQETDFGFGVKYRSFQLDVAQGIQTLGTTTRVSLTTRFGPSISERHQEEVKRMIVDALRAFQDGDFQLARDRMQAAAEADPGNPQIRRMLNRLDTAVGYVKEATGSDDVSVFERRGVVAYVDGRDLKSAVNALRYAFNKAPKDGKLLAMLNLAEKEAGVSELTRKPEGPEIFTFIDQKIFDARQAIYQTKYDLALQRCQDVLELEPRNETALEIMGSALFLMEQKEKARQVWLRVIEINPNNKVVQEFLRKIK